MPVTVLPESFTMVDFDAAEIRAVAERVAADVGLADHDITVTVDERTPLSRTRVRSLDPIAVAVDGGAFEDLRRLRQQSEERIEAALGLHLRQTADRLDPAFGAPDLDDEIELPHQTAWDVYALGRLARIGHRSQRGRRLYHFRNRHGFTDAADAAFERLWTADGLTWAAIVALSDSLQPAAV